jgi:O-acetyl-ADP-ribose deacetylase (regulator of RNase III)
MSLQIIPTKGNLLEADVEALVNTVNTVGVMGKGIALQFRQAFTDNYMAYQAACKHGEVQPGHMFVTETRALTGPRYIINFPTKRDWRAKAKMEDIDAGLIALIAELRDRQIYSVAVPPLGCGNGGLKWEEVRPRIEAAFEALPDVQVLLFTPDGAPVAETMRVETKRPNMSWGRAAIVGLLEAYILPGASVSQLEIQKLAYFLQVAGAPLRLSFEKAQYGPYAETLHHVLQKMEGHFLRGYGDRSRDASLQVLSDASREADLVLEEHPETRVRLDQVRELVEGFETPYSLELLATVHWLAWNEDETIRHDSDAAVRGVKAWSTRKKGLFSEAHIEIAWKRLQEQGWI